MKKKDSVQHLGNNDRDERMKELLSGLGDRRARAISLAMREYLLANRDAIYGVPDEILSGELKDSQIRELINILGIIGVDEAQQALVRIASSSEFSDENRLRAVISFTSVTEPLTDDSLTFLISHLSNIVRNDPRMDISTASVLAIGSISKKLMDKYPERAAELADALISRLNTADSLQKRFLIKSLGNTASAEYSDDIVEYLNSSDSELRRAAAEALKFMDDKYSEKALSEVLPVESDENVVEAVVKSLSKRELSKETIGTIREIAPKQTNTDSRRIIIDIMGETIKDNPKNRETLTQMLANETSRVNMKRILKAVGNSVE